MTDELTSNSPLGFADDDQMAGILAQAQEMQQRLLAAEQEIANTTLTGTAACGLVSVSGTGTGVVTDMAISPEIVNPNDVATLQNLIVEALADMSRRREALNDEKLGPLTSGF